MDSIGLLALLCGSMIVSAGLAGIVYMVVNTRKSKKRDDQTHAVRPLQTTQAGFKSWLIPIVVALVLALWSVVFALFFLAIVWVMRLDPEMHSKEIPFPSDKDRNRAKGTYTWLLLSPFLNVIILNSLVIASFNLGYNPSTNERAISALIPLLIHLPLLTKLDSKSPFVFRHTQQAIFLLALRASMTALALNISRYPEDGLWLFFIGNGSLWLFGSFWGRGQANKGTGWWIKQKGEKVLKINAVQSEPIMAGEIEETLKSMDSKTKNTRIKQSLNTFRTGTPEERKKALLVLSQLGEVEKF